MGHIAAQTTRMKERVTYTTRYARRPQYLHRMEAEAQYKSREVGREVDLAARPAELLFLIYIGNNTVAGKHFTRTKFN